MIKIKNRLNTKVNKKIIIISSTVMLLIAIILYALADRYLIEKVEVVVEPTSINTFADTNTTDTTIDSIDSDTDATTTSNNIYYDDSTYKSDNIEINIEKIETGSGSDKITYFVADIILEDSTYLNSAFAKNAFGSNIVETTSEIAENNDAIFAINGDYYGFRSDGVLIRNGVLYRDIPTRTGAAFYTDGSLLTYDEEEVSSEELLDMGVTNTYSFGPILISDGEVTKDFTDTKIDSNFGNRTIDGSNPRTGIGMIEPNHFVFIVVDGRDTGYSKGMTLSEFANVFDELGCTEAYNLDGGGSSTMYFMGNVVNDPLGKGEERSVSDIIFITE
ncbi:phosphodiester glycosidase family protein [Clostridium sp. DL1XJH146]